jgi:diguanylate cyclase (GGDEF)-like protein
MDALDDVPELLRGELEALLQTLANCEAQLAGLRSAAIEVCRSADRIVTCPLTGLVTRAEGERIVNRELERASASGSRLAILFLDGDGLKRFNDEHGDHRAGDEAIARMGEQVLVEAKLRGRDLGIRWAGDEFVLVLPGTTADGASVVALRIQQAVRRISIRNHALSFSIGIADMVAGDGVATLVSAADLGAYEAKARGRNTVVVVSRASDGTTTFNEVREIQESR